MIMLQAHTGNPRDREVQMLWGQGAAWLLKQGLGLVERDPRKCFPKEWGFKQPGTTEVEYSMEKVHHPGCILLSPWELKQYPYTSGPA